MVGRTVILVSHHVQLCAPHAAYIVALDNGRVQFSGSKDEFKNSSVLRTLQQSTDSAGKEEEDDSDKGQKQFFESKKEIVIADELESMAAKTAVASSAASTAEAKAPRKLIEEERRAVGRISRSIWSLYLRACGGKWYWSWFGIVGVICSLNPVIANAWLKYVIFPFVGKRLLIESVESGQAAESTAWSPPRRSILPCFTSRSMPPSLYSASYPSPIDLWSSIKAQSRLRTNYTRGSSSRSSLLTFDSMIQFPEEGSSIGSARISKPSTVPSPMHLAGAYSLPCRPRRQSSQSAL